MLDHWRKWLKKRYTAQVIIVFVTLNIIIFGVHLICSKLFKIPFPFSLPLTSSSITNFYFALITIASIGFSLSFSPYEVDELKEFQEKIDSSKQLPENVKDFLVTDISLKIKDAKPTNFKAVKFYLVITLCLSGGIIVNEIMSGYESVISYNVVRFLKIEGLPVLIGILWHIHALYKFKQRLIKLCVSEYDKSIKTIVDVAQGNYTNLLPKT
jgi:hypothetical protein